MVRIADILKRGKGDEEEPKRPEEVKKDLMPEPEIEETIKEEERLPSHVEIARIMMEKTKAGRPEPKEIYDELITLVKDILAKGERYEPIEGKEIAAKIDRVADQMTVSGDELIGQTTNFSPENYLWAHSVNVCILSIKLGLGLGYSKTKLNDLGISALLCDIGMVKVIDIASQPRSLTVEEYNEIKQHPIYGVEILTKAKDLSKVAIYVAHEEHERMTGTGYPRGLKNGKINEYARIVGLVDTYEALTHPRPHRNKLSPFEAIKEILKDKDGFDPRFLKVLINAISVYPIGSWVELSTSEVGKVNRIHKDFPLRPTVTVIFSPDGQKLDEPKSIDLTKHPTLYIKKPLDGNELESRFTASE